MKNARWFIGMVLILIISSSPTWAIPFQQKDSIKTLVITGAAPYGYHPWESNIEIMESRLQTFDKIDTEYLIAKGLEDWRKWDGQFSDYDAILIIYYWSQAPEANLKRLDQYVRNGGALVVAHSALAGFWNQEVFDQWTGIAYRERDASYGHSLVFNKEKERIIRAPGEGGGSGHAPIDTFQIQTQDPDHPIMQGLPQKWMQSRDELYYSLRGPNTNIHTLAVAKGPDSTFTPQAWVRRHDQGRIFCLTPGHHKPGVSSVGFITLLARGIEWTATGEVTLPVPSNFPGEHQPSTEPPVFK